MASSSIETNSRSSIQFTHGNVKSQKYLLRGIELTIKLFKKDLLPKVAHILKAFYDFDILSEEAILDWGSKSRKKSVGKELAEDMRSKAAPFLKWLEEADEEESSSGDEDSDEEDPWSETKPEPVNLNGNGSTANKVDVEDKTDFNIDDI